MTRQVTVTFEDNTNHVYDNVPNNVTPSEVEQRATAEFKKKVVNIDGGSAPKEPQSTDETKPLGSMGLGEITSGYAMGLKDPISGMAQMVPRGFELLTSAGGAYPNVVSGFFGQEAARMDALIKAEEEARKEEAALRLKKAWKRYHAGYGNHPFAKGKLIP